MRLPLLFALAAVAASGSAQTRTYLNIGDQAPVVAPAKWLKGAPIPAFEKGKVYVVEFWATWCTPCKQNIPHLTDLAKKFKGKASILGVDVWESQDPEATTTIPKVAAFVKSMGAKMEYHVAVDTGNNRVANAWLKQADESGLPVTFIVGKDGKIAWIGHPSILEKVLQQVVDDKFDVAAARNQRAVEVEYTRPLHEAMEAKQYQKALDLIEEKTKQRPERASMYAYDRLVALFHVDLPKASSEAEKLLEDTKGDIGIYQMISSIFASQKDFDEKAYRYGRRIIDQAIEKNDRLYLFLAMGAEVDSSLGDKQGAVKSQEAAVKAAEVDPHAPKEFVDFLRKNLERFKKAAAG